MSSISLDIPFYKERITTRPSHILIVLVIVGTIIRFYGLTYSGLWLDEIFSMIGSDPNTTVGDVYEYSIHDQPPLFFILLQGWLKVFGYTDFAGRALTCLYGVMGIVGMYFLGKEMKDEKLGLFASFITTINWFHTDISKEIRFYPLVFLLTTLSFLFFLRSIKKSGFADFILYAFFTALLVNTHYYGMVVFVTQLLIFVLILIFFKKTLRLIIGGLLAGSLAGLSLWHWLPVIMSDLQIDKFHVNPVTFFFPFSFAWDYIKDPVAFIVYSACALFAVFALYNTIKSKKFAYEHLIVLCWISFSYMIPLLYSWIKIPLLTYKYSTIAVPAIFLAIAFGFTHLKTERIRAYCIILIVISGFIMLFIARPPYKPRRGEDWREVAAYFDQKTSSTEVIFSQLSWYHIYYFKKINHALPYNQNNCDFEAIVGGTDRLWLLMNDRYTGGWPISGFLPDQKSVIDREFEVIDSIKFKQTTAFLFTRKK